MKNNTAIKSINDLIEEKCHFFVEDYQRGYKWTNNEVVQLLDDINDFDEKDGFYCLQPVIVKNIEENKYELIDGQQRITTIFIILNFLNESKFEIAYKTRKSSEDFLININGLSEETEWKKYLKKVANKENDNIDNFHFFTAFKSIKEWFDTKEKVGFKKDEFIKKLGNKVKVIWYLVPSSHLSTEESKKESIALFTRINTGKIPLTNAELIKALFLINVDTSSDSEKLQLKQNEIAQQWDTFEYALQDDDFWFFISNEAPPATRIDLLFDLVIKNKEDQEKKLFTFLEYNRLFSCEKNEKQKSVWVKNKWEDVKKMFLTLREWYEDRELYHLIGFIIQRNYRNDTIEDLLDLKIRKTKEEFRNAIGEKCISTIDTSKLNELEYGDSKIKNILLFYNVLTVLKNETSNNFSFATFKAKKWDIEHVHAQASKTIGNKKDQNDWMKEVKTALEKIDNDYTVKDKIKIFGEINSLLEQNDSLTNDDFNEAFKKVYQNVISYFDLLNNKESELNALSNLVLLDAGTNRSYGNAIFSEKRNVIIEKDKMGVFIPVCTKNVFLKYYSQDATQMYLWTKNDQMEYFANIKDTLNEFDKKIKGN